MPIRVAIIEDDSEMRVSFERTIHREGDFVLCGSYSSAEAFMGRNDPLESLDVVLTDIQLPGISGIQCIADRKPKCPKVQYVVITVFEDTANIFNALCAGATGYLLKTASDAEIVQAVHDVHAGGSPMSLAIARMVVGRAVRKQQDNTLLNSLSKREYELVHLLAEGFRYKEIADRLELSLETVRTYIRAIYTKLQVHSRTDALNKLFER